MKKWLPTVLAALVIQALVIALVMQPEPAPDPWQPMTPVPLPTSALEPGRPAVLYFWATWCEPCVRHLHETLALAAIGGIDLWLVSRDAQWSEVERHFGGIVPRVVVHDTGLGDALGVEVLPTSFVIDSNGQAVARLRGTLDHAAVHSAVGRTLSSRPGR